MEDIRAVELGEDLHRIRVADGDAAREQHHGQDVEVVRRDEVGEPIEAADDDHQRRHHAESRQHGAEDEEGREFGRVPARRHSGSEIQADDAVD